MSVSKAKGDKAVADLLFSRLVRSRGACQRCGDTTFSKLACAHIVRRGWAWTRTHLNNAWCLCGTCHAIVDDDPEELLALVDATIGREVYHDLRDLARENVGRRFDWADERARLALLCRESGIETKRSAPGWELAVLG